MKVFVRQYLTPSESSDTGYSIYTTTNVCKYNPKHAYDPDDWVFLCEEEVELPDPEFDVRETILKGLKGQEQRLMADYSKNMASIKDKISKLMALEMIPDDEDGEEIVDDSGEVF
jgi:hypothetical protein